MSVAQCRNCRTPILDYTSVVETQGRIYCCGNCAATARDAEPVQPDQPTCARCDAPLIEAEGAVERSGLTFCCYNCAAAAGSLTPARLAGVSS
jgi:hypothetical protein